MRSSDRVRPRLVRRGHDRHLQQFLFGHAPKYVFERYAKVREEGGLPIGIRWKKSDSDLNYHPQLDNSGNFASFRKWPKLLKRWWTRPGSNRRPPRCERGALPAELLAHEQQLNFSKRGRPCQHVIVRVYTKMGRSDLAEAPLKTTPKFTLKLTAARSKHPSAAQ